MQIQSPVAAYSLSNGLLSGMPVSQTPAAYQRSFAASISANGAINGILWLVTFGSRLAIRCTLSTRMICRLSFTTAIKLAPGTPSLQRRTLSPPLSPMAGCTSGRRHNW